MTSAAKKDYEIENGIYVKEVQSESPAFEAGIKNGDIILSINDQPVVSVNSFYSIVSSYKAEDKLIVKIKRAAGSTIKENEITVVLTEKLK